MIKRTNLGLMVAAIMVVLIGAGSARADLTDGLIAHWKLDGDANDSAGSNDGTPVNGPVWTTGQIGGALEFDGIDDYVLIPDTDSISVGNQDYTISTWINPRSLTGPVTIVSKVKDGGDKEYLLWIRDGDLWLGVEKNANNQAAYTTTAPVQTDSWQHIAVKFNSSTTTPTFYYNGAVQTSVSNIDTLPDELNDDLYIGMTGGTYHSYKFNGLIDDVRIYDRALSAGEVHQLYGGELLGLEITGPNEVAEDSQVQYKAIAHCDNDTAVDVTDLADWSVEPNDNCGIAVGLLTTEPIDLPEDITIYAEYTEDGNSVAAEKEVEIFAVCPSGSALEFDGINDYVEIGDDDSLTPQSEITIAFWVYNRGGQTAGIFKYAGCPGDPVSPGDSRAYFLLVDNDRDDKINLGIYSAVDAVDYLFGNTTNISLNQWHHIAGTFNAGQAKVYLDGNLDNSKTMSVSSIMNDAHPLIIGGHWKYCGGQPNFYSRLNGTMDEVRIYDRALSAEQIQTLMHTRPASGEPNLVGYWDFDEGEGQLAGDSSGNYNDGTLGSTGGVDDSDPNWTDSIPPVGICSLEGLVGRNISNVLDIKADILELLDIALGKEEALFDYMDDAFHNGELDNLNKNDVVQAKQNLHSAIQAEKQAENAVDHSVNKLDDALDALGIDPTSWHQSEIEEEIIRADINADGVVDFRDFTILTEHWLKYYGP